MTLVTGPESCSEAHAATSPGGLVGLSIVTCGRPLAGSRNRYLVSPEIAEVSALSDLEGTQQAGPAVSPGEPRTPGGSGSRARGGASSFESANPPLAVLSRSAQADRRAAC